MLHTSEDAGIKRDLSTIVRQAQRIGDALEKMRKQVRESRDRARHGSLAPGTEDIT